MTSHFKAVLFDLDGTLLDTLVDLADSMNTILKRFGYPPHATESYRYFVGDGMEKLVIRSLPPGNYSPEDINLYIREIKMDYHQRWPHNSRPYDGISDMLDELESLHIPAAIFSNKPDEFTREMVDKLLPHWKFAETVGATSAVPRKRDPTGAISIAEKMMIAPQHFLYLGDTNTDMQTATRAGMFGVGAAWGFRSVEELLENGAQCIIRHPSEIIPLLQQSRI